MTHAQSLVVLALCATLLVGCTGDGENGQNANQATTAAAPAQESAPAASPSTAPSDGRSMHPAMPMVSAQDAAAAQHHSTTGTVTAVDAAQGKITPAHEAVPSLQWPAMTMSFQVKDSTTLEELRVGDQVQFTFAKQGDVFVIGEISKP